MESKERDEVRDGAGLLCGVTAWHLRMLAENSWNGGGGYSWEQIGEMTLDQIWARLCDLELLKKEVGERVQSVGTQLAASSLQTDEDGYAKGRAADGTPIRARIRGKSWARQLMEEEAEMQKLARMGRKELRGYLRNNPDVHPIWERYQREVNEGLRDGY